MNKVRHILNPIGQFFPLSPMIKMSGQNLFLPYYHSIQGESELKHIKHLYKPKSKNEFEREIDYLLKYFEPISLNRLQEYVFQKKTFKKPSFHLSFDDGLKEVYEIVMPILQKKGIPATIFLNSNFIDNRDLFFRYKISLIIEKLTVSKFNADYSASKVLSLTFQDINEIDEIAEKLEIDFHSFLEATKPYLTTNHVKGLISKGFTIGAHSENHPKYSDLTFEEQITQTSNSVKAICKRFELDYEVFSFPFTDFGVQEAFFEKIYKDKIAQLTFSSAGLKNDIHKQHLHRTQMEDNGQKGETMIKTEYLYYILKTPFGKNMAKRV